jgi:hypothetical protein
MSFQSNAAGDGIESDKTNQALLLEKEKAA